MFWTKIKCIKIKFRHFCRFKLIKLFLLKSLLIFLQSLAFKLRNESQTYSQLEQVFNNIAFVRKLIKLFKVLKIKVLKIQQLMKICREQLKNQLLTKYF